VINGQFYLAGGAVASGIVSAALESYNPATNLWTNQAPMPTQRLEAASGVINGLLYVVGGEDAAGTVVNSAVVYTPATSSWRTLSIMPTARSFLAAGVIKGALYVVGGFNSNSAPFLTTNEAYTH
jgi:N-acetylneuraminic acid mutarotase